VRRFRGLYGKMQDPARVGVGRLEQRSSCALVTSSSLAWSVTLGNKTFRKWLSPMKVFVPRDSQLLGEIGNHASDAVMRG